VTLRTILVGLTGTAADPVALGAAFDIASRFDAHVDALFLWPDPSQEFKGLHPQEGWRALVDEMEAIEAEAAEAERRAAAAEHFFAAARTGATAPSAAFRRLAGGPELITREGRLTDLLVFSHIAPQDERRAYVTLETALLTAGRPLLLVPATAAKPIGSTIAIAWHGNVHAARAVAGAMPFLESAAAVHVLTVETDEIAAEEGRRLADYLARHGIEAEVAVLQAGRAAMGELLLDKAAALGADLLVMGGYGHSRIREVILGGITQHVLAHPQLPLLLGH
jgi:nucleotide-binding universal stress UspA family protein